LDSNFFLPSNNFQNKPNSTPNSFGNNSVLDFFPLPQINLKTIQNKQPEEDEEEWSDFTPAQENISKPLQLDNFLKEANEVHPTGSFQEKIPNETTQKPNDTQGRAKSLMDLFAMSIEKESIKKEEDEEEWSDFTPAVYEKSEHSKPLDLKQNTFYEIPQKKEFNLKNNILDMFGPVEVKSNSSPKINDWSSNNGGAVQNRFLEIGTEEKSKNHEITPTNIVNEMDDEWGDFQGERETMVITDSNVVSKSDPKINILDLFSQTETVQSIQPKKQEDTQPVENPTKEEEEEEWGNFEKSESSENQPSNLVEKINTPTITPKSDLKMNILDLFSNLETKTESPKPLKLEDGSSKQITEIQPLKEIESKKFNILDIFDSSNETILIPNLINEQMNPEKVFKNSNVHDTQPPQNSFNPAVDAEVEDEWGEFEKSETNAEYSDKDVKPNQQNIDFFSQMDVEPMKSVEQFETSSNFSKSADPVPSVTEEDEWGDFEGEKTQTETPMIVEKLNETNGIVEMDSLKVDSPKISESKQTTKSNPKMSILDLFSQIEPTVHSNQHQEEDEEWGDFEKSEHLPQLAHETNSKSENETNSIESVETKIEPNIPISEPKINILDLFSFTETKPVESKSQQFEDEEEWGDFEGEIQHEPPFVDKTPESIVMDPELSDIPNSNHDISQPAVADPKMNILDLFSQFETKKVEIPKHSEEDEEWGDFETSQMDDQQITTVPSNPDPKINILDLFSRMESRVSQEEEFINSIESKDEQYKEKDSNSTSFDSVKKSESFDSEDEIKKDHSENNTKLNYNETQVEEDEEDWGDFETSKEEKLDYHEKSSSQSILDLFISSNESENKIKENEEGEEDWGEFEASKEDASTEIISSLKAQERFDDILNLNESINHQRLRLDPISHHEMLKLLTKYASKEISDDFNLKYSEKSIGLNINEEFELKEREKNEFDEILKNKNPKIRMYVECLRELENCFKFLEGIQNKNTPILQRVLESEKTKNYFSGIQLIFNIIEESEMNGGLLFEFKKLFEKFSNFKLENEGSTEIKFCSLCGRFFREGDLFCKIKEKYYYSPAVNFWKNKISKVFPI
jgi:hypothetical protein